LYVSLEFEANVILTSHHIELSRSKDEQILKD